MILSLPFVARLRESSARDLRGDVVAGTTTMIMMVPQGMAYASLAGLPPVHGLYAALVPSLLYALLGSSRSLSVGPVAIDSMIVAAGLAPLAISEPHDYAAAAALLMLLVGLVQVVVRILRLATLARYVRPHILLGFTAGAAVHIGASQFGPILGIPVPKGLGLASKLLFLGEHLGQASLLSLAVAFLGTLALLVMRGSNLRFLMVLAASSLAAWWLHAPETSLGLVGAVPAGLPSFQSPFPVFSFALLSSLLPTALVLALISFVGTVAVGKALDGEDPLWSARRELAALSWANIGGSFFQAYSISGGFSRSAVNQQAGAKSSFAGLVAVLGVASALLWLTPLFYWIPEATLGAIIVVATMSLFKVGRMKILWRQQRQEFWLMGATLSAVLVFGVVEGLLVGVAFDLIWKRGRGLRDQG